MKRLHLYITLAFAALTLAIAVPVAFSRGPGPGNGPGKGDGPRGDRHAFVMQQLGLNTQQTAALEALRNDHRDDVASLHEQIQAKREAMKALWLVPSPDRNQILAAEREISALRMQLAESRVDFLFGVKGALSPEQFAKFIELRKERGFGHHGFGRHGRGGGKGGGECRGDAECPFGGPRRGPPIDVDD